MGHSGSSHPDPALQQQMCHSRVRQASARRPGGRRCVASRASPSSEPHPHRLSPPTRPLRPRHLSPSPWLPSSLSPALGAHPGSPPGLRHQAQPLPLSAALSRSSRPCLGASRGPPLMAWHSASRRRSRRTQPRRGRARACRRHSRVAAPLQAGRPSSGSPLRPLLMEAPSPWPGPSRQLPLLPTVVQLLLNPQRPQGQHLLPCFQAARLLRQSAQSGLPVQVCLRTTQAHLGTDECCFRLLEKSFNPQRFKHTTSEEIPPLHPPFKVNVDDDDK